jgi:hypothetical protein
MSDANAETIATLNANSKNEILKMIDDEIKKECC